MPALPTGTNFCVRSIEIASDQLRRAYRANKNIRKNRAIIFLCSPRVGTPKEKYPAPAGTRQEVGVLPHRETSHRGQVNAPGRTTCVRT